MQEGESDPLGALEKAARDLGRNCTAPRGACTHLFALIESTQDIIFSVDLDYRLVTFNRSFAQYVEKSWGGVVAKAGMDAFELLPRSQAELWPPFFSRALREGPYRLEYVLKDGRWLELSFNPIIDEGTSIGVSVFGKDTTERKLAEEFRKASERRFRTLAEQAPSAIGIARNGFNLYVNQKYVQMFGLNSAGEAIGRPVRESWAPEWQTS